LRSWIVIILSALGVALLLWTAERAYELRGQGESTYPKHFGAGVYESYYRVFGKLFNVVSDMHLRSLPSKIICFAWAICVV
jgi:hypothetical protein